MKAIVLNRFGPPKEAFELKDVPTPSPNPTQVLIEAETFGLNFADVLARNGLYPEVPDRPCVIGYEVVGKVIGQGSEVPENMLGKRVIAMTRFGGYAQYAATDYRATAEISPEYPAEKAVALATQYTTAYVCTHEVMNLYPGDRVLVHAGAGGVGIALCQIALRAGCEVFATAGSNEKVDFLKKLGVQRAINYRCDDYSQICLNELKDKRLDATYNSLAGKSISKDLKLLGSGGKLVLFGAASRVGKGSGKLAALRLLWNTGFITPLALIMRSKSIIGVNMLKLGDYKPQLVANAMKRVVALANQGEIDPVAYRHYPVDEINTAHLELENRNTIGKLSVYWRDRSM